MSPHERQREYLRASDKYRFTLYGGARGGGKSYIERWRHVRFLLKLTAQGIKNVQTGIFCNTFKEARKRQFIPSRDHLGCFPEWLGKHNEGNLEFIFHKEWGGHRIAFLNLEDPSQYKSDQFATIGVEEITLCADPGIIDLLCGSLRWPGVPWTPFCATTNPDGPGHSWVKGLWITKSLFSHPDYAKKKAGDFHFVRALPTDNPFLPEEYITEVLEGLTESLRKPWLEGSWDLFEGQRFAYNPRVHECAPLPRESLRGAKFYCSIDYGFDNPFAAGFYAVLPEGNRPQVYKIRELNESGLKARQQAHKVLEEIENLDITLAEPAFLDTACWAEEEDGLSIAQKFMQEGLPVQQVLKSRPTGWVAVEDLLAWEHEPGDPYTITKQPRMKLYPSCVLTAQQLTDALWDPKKPGDIQHPEGFRDDSLDETRYFALTHMQPPKPEKPPTPDDYMRRVEKAMRRGRRL